jgi:hypothetical protein
MVLIVVFAVPVVDPRRSKEQRRRKEKELEKEAEISLS